MNDGRERWAVVAPWLIFGFLVFVLAAGLYNPASWISSRQKITVLHDGASAPLTSLPLWGQAGLRFSTASWRGRPYVVHFFANDCDDCRADRDQLATMAAGHVAIVGVAVKDSADQIAAYVSEGNPFITVARDGDGRAADQWGVATLPETFLVDSYGIVRWHYIGRLTDDIVGTQLMPAWEAVQDGG
ncbi:MAG: redoxin domain-containing protein [Alphaproteobacteria bacterium]|nr:redoxin domain-containing protein [Alphaproteobacteria bacterium]